MRKKNPNASRWTYRCSFCSKGQEQVERLIAGPGGVYICNECIDLCREIIEEEHVMMQSTGTAQDRTASTQLCSSCGTHCGLTHTYCFHCGHKLASAT